MAPRKFFGSARANSAPAHPVCHRCSQRYPQSSLGLCRRCEREQGITRQIQVVEREAEMALELVERTSRELTIDGQTFEVVWDGR
jgi:hypothetical protein